MQIIISLFFMDEIFHFVSTASSLAIPLSIDTVLLTLKVEQMKLDKIN